MFVTIKLFLEEPLEGRNVRNPRVQQHAFGDLDEQMRARQLRLGLQPWVCQPIAKTEECWLDRRVNP